MTWLKKIPAGLILGLAVAGQLEASFTSLTQSGGTDSAYQTTPQTLSGTILGLANFAGGLTLSDGNGVIWKASGSVGSTLTFNNNYTLTLANSIHLAPGTTVTNDGGYALIKFDGFTPTPPRSIYLDGEDIIFNKPLWVNTLPLTLDGLGHTLTVRQGISFGSSGFEPSSLTLANMNLLTQNASFIFNDNISGKLTLKDVTIKPIQGGIRKLFIGSGSVTSFRISGDVRIEGPGSIVAFWSNITIDANSSLYIGPGVTVYALGVAVAGMPVGVTMTNSTSLFHLDGCDFYTGGNGMQVLGGTVLFSNKVRIFNGAYSGGGSFTPNTDMVKAFTLGDGTAPNDVEVRVLGGGYVITNGCMHYNHS